MDEQVQRRMKLIELLAKGDEEYSRMLRENRELERKHDEVLQTLPTEQRDAVCDFVTQCEEMSWRMLELACTYMRFPE
ncbi:MAG: hypothetical protein UEP57_01905 [Oscillospiraceae bacterium]|nr:hypothetical protein [Oscillospiraceae bacterium]